MTLSEIAEKAGCTYDEVVQAILDESEGNKKIYEAGRKEAEAQRKKLEAEFKTLEAENKKLELLIHNDALVTQWKVISHRVKSELVGQPEPPKLKLV